MLLFNLIRLTKQRIALLLLASLTAGAIGFTFAQASEPSHSSTAIVFTSQLFREDRTDAELNNLVDDLMLATELKNVSDAVEAETALEVDADYTVMTERVVGGGDTVEITATANNSTDAEAAALATSKAAVTFLINQDVNQASSSQEAIAAAASETHTRLEELRSEAGGVSPIVLHQQAEEALATLINDRSANANPTIAETQLVARVANAAVLRSEYEQLEAQINGYQEASVDSQDAGARSNAVLASLDTELVVKNSVENSVLPLIIQGVLVAILITLGLALALFAFLDRKSIAERADAGRAANAAARSKRTPQSTDAAFTYEGAAQQPATAKAAKARPAAKAAAAKPAAAKAKAAKAVASKPAPAADPSVAAESNVVSNEPPLDAPAQAQTNAPAKKAAAKKAPAAKRKPNNNRTKAATKKPAAAKVSAQKAGAQKAPAQTSSAPKSA